MADANELPVEQIESKEPIADGGKEPNLPTETVDWKSKYEQDIKEREAKLSEYDQRMRDKDRYVNEQQKQLEAYKKYESVLQRLQADQEKRNQVERQSKIQRGDFSPVVDEAVSKTQAALAEKLAQVDQYIQMTQRQQMEAQVKAEETELMAGLQSTFSDQDRKTIGPFVSDFLKNVWQTQGVEKFKEWAKDPMTLKRIGRDMYIESQQKQQAREPAHP